MPSGFTCLGGRSVSFPATAWDQSHGLADGYLTRTLHAGPGMRTRLNRLSDSGALDLLG